MYSLDTNCFMDWQARYYPIDVFTTLESKISAMIASGTCGAIDLVKEEIDAVGTPRTEDVGFTSKRLVHTYNSRYSA